MAKPNHLFIVGAQRSGTTYLWEIFNAHPEIQMAHPVRPEPKYFLKNTEKDFSYEIYFNSYFKRDKSVKWFGEKSTSYIEYENVAKEISVNFPNAFIMVILRDPVERAISNYFFSRQNGLENLSFAQSLSEEKLRLQHNLDINISVSPYAYIERGKYMKYLSFWLKYFPQENLKILVAEEFLCNHKAISQLFSSLGINSNFWSEVYEKKYNSNIEMPSDLTINPSIYDELADKFSPWNRELTECFGVNISMWRGMSESFSS